jgi:hypothetical protein
VCCETLEREREKREEEERIKRREREKRKERKREVSNGGNQDAPQTSMNVLIEDTVICSVVLVLLLFRARNSQEALFSALFGVG